MLALSTVTGNTYFWSRSNDSKFSKTIVISLDWTEPAGMTTSGSGIL